MLWTVLLLSACTAEQATGDDGSDNGLLDPAEQDVDSASLDGAGIATVLVDTAGGAVDVQTGPRTGEGLSLSWPGSGPWSFEPNVAQGEVEQCGGHQQVVMSQGQAGPGIWVSCAYVDATGVDLVVSFRVSDDATAEAFVGRAVAPDGGMDTDDGYDSY